jgi:brefeldin A-inhibited guanine nucleotide-exchange protein
MQRVAEVTAFNMDRFKLIWNRIWAELSQFFYLTGTHANPDIAEVAVDLLKQLACKFL